MEDKERFDEGAVDEEEREEEIRIRDGYPVTAPETPPLRKDPPVPEIWRGLELGVLRRRPFEEELG